MVYTELAETATVSRGTRRVSALYAHHLGEYSKTRYKKKEKKLFTNVETHASSASLFESGE